MDTAELNRPETPSRAVAVAIADEFDQGPGYTNWRPRGSHDWLLIYTVDGAGLIGVGDREAHRLEPGHLVMYAPGAAQDYRCDPEAGRWGLLWTHFQPRAHWLPWLQLPELAAGVHHTALGSEEARARVVEALRRMVAALRRPVAFAPDLGLVALEEALVWINGSVHPTEPWLRVDARVRRAMDYLVSHATEPFRFEAVARHCGLSPSRLGHLFKQELDVTPQRFSEELRVRHAQRLLAHTSLTVGEIATATGFGDAFYFAKRFRRATGASPTEWRRRAQGPGRRKRDDGGREAS